jgi:hypothetical protein
MVKRFFSELLVFASTVLAPVTTRHSVAPNAWVLSYRESNNGHVDGLFL